MTLDIHIEESVETKKYGFEEEVFYRLSDYILQKLFVETDTVVSLNIVCVDEMSRLHVEWMGIEGPTDVLSFPMDELVPGTETEPTRAGVLGDIVLNLEVASAQADAAGHSVMNELTMLFTHGMLHLLGFDHAEPIEEEEMFALQRSLLESFAASEKN